MLKSIARLLLSCCVIALFTGCNNHVGHDHNHEGHDHEAESEHGHEGHDHIHSEGGRTESGLIVLEHQQLEELGVKVTEVKPGSFADVLKVSGQITQQPGSDGVVAARQGGIVKLSNGISEGVNVSAGRTIATVNSKGMQGGDQGEAARAAYNAAKRELDRITPLHKEGIVSTKDYNAALQRVEETRAALGSSGGNNAAATAPISGVITSIEVADGQYVDAGQTIATVGSNKALTLRAELPENKASALPSITGAKFIPAYSSTVIDIADNGGKLLSTPTAASAANGYIPIYFTLSNSSAHLIGGSYCEVYLLGAPRENVITVPEKAISEQQGKYFVYVEVAHEHFKKQPVMIGQTDGNRREILSGIKAGDNVVTEGMTYVRLAETSGVVPEGHSHNH